MKPKIFLLLSLIALLASCVKKPDSYPPEPQIYYLSTRPNVINVKDTSLAGVKIELKFTDGDGDIGRDPKQEVESVFLRYSKDTSTTVDYTFPQPFPFIDENMRPDGGGLEGFITLNITKAFFLIITDSLHIALGKDTVHWDVYIKDEAGHKSNVISTDPIYLEF